MAQAAPVPVASPDSEIEFDDLHTASGTKVSNCNSESGGRVASKFCTSMKPDRDNFKLKSSVLHSPSESF